MEHDRHAARYVGKLSNKLRRQMESFSTKGQMSGAQGKVLHFLLAQKGDVFQKDVEEEYSLRPSSATQLLQKMEQDGLIRRESLPGDARRKRIVVCPKGLAYKAAVMEDIRTLEAQLTKGIDPDDLETFLRVMEQMLKNIP